MSPDEKKQAGSRDDIVATSSPPEQDVAQTDTTPKAKGLESPPLVDGSETGPVVILKPGVTDEPAVSPEKGKSDTSPVSNPPQVHVAPHLLDLVTGRSATPAEQQAAQEQRDLNEIVHQMLVIGLILSTALMLVGLALDLTLGREVPTAVPDFGDIFNRVIALRPSGFLALGLLVLIATPILRVVGSIFAFLYERDWRYTGITLLVLGIVMVSLVMGKG